MTCTIEKLNWTTAYLYKTDRFGNIELTLPFETMKGLCDKYGIDPSLGAGEVQFAAFRDWLYKHRRTHELFYGRKGFDIQSLVDLFNDDLKGTEMLMEGVSK